MRKEYHYTISRTDRICLVSFCICLLGWELIKLILPSDEKTFIYISEPRENTYPVYEKREYQNNNYSKNYHHYSKNYYSKKNYYTYNNEIKLEAPNAPIPIMTASVNELASTGLSLKVAYNIQKYVSSGGIVTGEKDLLKIYGMDSVQLIKASPYLIYASVEKETTLQEENKFEFKKYNHQPIVDLNTATLEDLESLNGIGSVLAERIVKFRESLGGFISSEQLKDCYGITPETYEKIKPQLQASGTLKIIPINEIDLTSFSHPYLNKKMSKMIEAYKDHHGPFSNADELRKVYPPDTGWCNKILPYLSFQINGD